jgi:hypothetical protein
MLPWQQVHAHAVKTPMAPSTFHLVGSSRWHPCGTVRAITVFAGGGLGPGLTDRFLDTIQLAFILIPHGYCVCVFFVPTPLQTCRVTVVCIATTGATSRL